MARIVFMGTPDFALPSFRALLRTQQVAAVVTQPDRPAGRRRQLRASPVKRLAMSRGIPTHQPRRVGSAESLAWLRELKPDALVVAAYGQILPQSLLDLPPYGAINVHASLLPRWRGAAPIQAAIREGDATTGATIMLMDAGLDTGAILSQREIAISNDAIGAELHDNLAQLGADLLAETLPRYFNGDIQPIAQDNSLATYAPSLKREQGRIDWTRTAAEIERQIRAYTPWPGSYALWDDAPLKIHAGGVMAGTARPGRVIDLNGAVAIGTAKGLFRPLELQLPGKRRLAVSDFVNGHSAFVGAQLA